MTTEHRAIQRAGSKSCDHCGKKTVKFLMTSESIYGTDFGPVYVCTSCWARVGAHKHTLKPKGTLANDELRQLRRQCHDLVDVVWKNKEATRHEVYSLLAQAMGRPASAAHIAQFNVADCRRLLSILQGSP